MSDRSHIRPASAAGSHAMKQSRPCSVAGSYSAREPRRPCSAADWFQEKSGVPITPCAGVPTTWPTRPPFGPDMVPRPGERRSFDHDRIPCRSEGTRSPSLFATQTPEPVVPSDVESPSPDVVHVREQGIQCSSPTPWAKSPAAHGLDYYRCKGRPAAKTPDPFIFKTPRAQLVAAGLPSRRRRAAKSQSEGRKKAWQQRSPTPVSCNSRTITEADCAATHVDGQEAAEDAVSSHAARQATPHAAPASGFVAQPPTPEPTPMPPTDFQGRPNSACDFSEAERKRSATSTRAAMEWKRRSPVPMSARDAGRFGDEEKSVLMAALDDMRKGVGQRNLIGQYPAPSLGSHTVNKILAGSLTDYMPQRPASRNTKCHYPKVSSGRATPEYFRERSDRMRDRVQTLYTPREMQ